MRPRIEVKTLERWITDWDRLRRIGRGLHRVDEARCNGFVDDRAQARVERREGRLEAQAAHLAAFWGMEVYRQSDPRGCSLYLYREKDLGRFGEGADIGTYYSSVGLAVPNR